MNVQIHEGGRVIDVWRVAMVTPEGFVIWLAQEGVTHDASMS